MLLGLRRVLGYEKGLWYNFVQLWMELMGIDPKKSGIRVDVMWVIVSYSDFGFCDFLLAF